LSYQSLFQFEKDLAEYTGAPFVVVTDGCTSAVELCLRYDQVTECEFTAFTYLSIPMLMHRLNIKYTLTDESWIGEYRLHGTRIWDSARLLRPNMYRPGSMQCLSFGNTKPLQLGRAGAILLDDEDAYNKLSMMRSDGRDLRIVPWVSQNNFSIGYHYTPMLETCELGIAKLPLVDPETKYVKYNDCRLINIS
jgi:dTDP-4-amino-4,6-dideoxygalactose transaminase